jgi:hypothetical protein
MLCLLYTKKEAHMFKVFPVEKGFQIFWCPSAPMHYADKIPHDERVYKYRQAAYRRKKQLQEALEKTDKRKAIKKEAA